MNRKLILGSAAGMLILAILACGPASPTSAPTVAPTAVPKPTSKPTEAQPTQAPSGETELVLENNSGISICFVYISSTESESWGENWMAENEVLRSGNRRTFQVPKGAYDLLARDCDGNLVDYYWGMNLAGSITWTLESLQRAPVLLVNNSDAEICYLYISPADSDSWGPNWMGKDTTIPAGNTRTFQVPLGDYDLRADDCDHNTLETQFNIAVEASGIAWTVTGGEGRGSASLTLVNGSEWEVCYVYISPSTSDSWGEDWLGAEESIHPGESRTFYLEAGSYDLRADDCDENTLAEEYNQEISGDMTWTLE